MMTGKYKFAGKTIEVISVYPDVHEYCKDYISDENADFTVQTSQEDIDFEQQRSDSENICEGKKPVKYPAGYLEELAVYRKIAEKMIEFDTVLFHGSVIAVDGKGYLFTAKSGTGKSTHTKLWREVFGERAVMVNDDKPLLGISDNQVIAYGTPYNGKHHIGNNISVPLKGICILQRNKENIIKKVNKMAVYSMLIQQIYRPSDRDKLKRTLELVDKMSENIDIYVLGCNMDREAAIVAYNGMKD
ncbi:MAG: hypothetical protein IJM19_00565 [Ruminococcus sp.]|nr:hypothetical protein [Ruminococcus sp.]